MTAIWMGLTTVASLVRDGGLMSYGPDMGEVSIVRRALPTGS